MEEADGRAFEPLSLRLVSANILQSGDFVSLQAAIQRRPAEIGNTGLMGVETNIQGQQSVAAECHDMASSPPVKTVERRCFGPVFWSSTEERLCHLATVFGLISSSRFNCASEV